MSTTGCSRPAAIRSRLPDERPPGAPKLGRGEPGDEARILDWDLTLIVVAVKRPSLDLAAIELAGVQQLMEGVTVVIAFGADSPERRFQCFGGEQRPCHGVSPIMKGADLLRGAPSAVAGGRPARAL